MFSAVVITGLFMGFLRSIFFFEFFSLLVLSFLTGFLLKLFLVQAAITATTGLFLALSHSHAYSFSFQSRFIDF